MAARTAEINRQRAEDQLRFQQEYMAATHSKISRLEEEIHRCERYVEQTDSYMPL